MVTSISKWEKFYEIFLKAGYTLISSFIRILDILVSMFVKSHEKHLWYLSLKLDSAVRNISLNNIYWSMNYLPLNLNLSKRFVLFRSEINVPSLTFLSFKLREGPLNSPLLLTSPIIGWGVSLVHWMDWMQWVFSKLVD